MKVRVDEQKLLSVDRLGFCFVNGTFLERIDVKMATEDEVQHHGGQEPFRLSM